MEQNRRLIDADDVYSLFDKNGMARLHVVDIDVIPMVDAVEVVRCQDCKYISGLKVRTYGCVWCRHFRAEMKKIDFCSYGERRANG